jgi:ABC-2 type transport system ATP-binding protein
MTILVSSHNLKELESFCTKIAMIQKGNLISCLNISNIKYNKHHYIFELDKVKIGNIISNYKIIDSNHIKVSTSKDKIPNIIQKLINQNIKIYSIQKEILSLEEVFLKKTGGNIIE